MNLREWSFWDWIAALRDSSLILFCVTASTTMVICTVAYLCD